LTPIISSRLLRQGQGNGLKSLRESTYYRSMMSWLEALRRDWDAVLAIFLIYVVVAIYLGPGYYFLLWYLTLCACVIRTALKR
jgi:hypothetical protein